MTGTDFVLPASTPMHTSMSTEFEGALITGLEGRLPAVKVECPEAYKRGTILKLSMEVRVKSVRLEENRDGDLTRSHVFAVESINVDEVYDPAQMIAELSGSIDTPADEVVAPLPVEIPGQLDITGETVEEKVRDLAERLSEDFNF